MTITEQLRVVEKALAAWVKKYAGKAQVTFDLENIFQLLTAATKPGSVLAIAQFTNEDKRGEHEEASMVDRTFIVVIQTARALTADGDVLRETDGYKPLTDLIEEARQVIRGIEFEPAAVVAAGTNTTEVVPDYKGCGIFVMPDGRAVTNAYQLTFSIGTVLGTPEERP